MSGLVSVAASSLTRNQSFEMSTAINMVAGYISAEAAGGDGLQGALNAAIVHLYNECVHGKGCQSITGEQRSRYKEVIESDGKVSLSEARYWSHHGGGETLNADLSKIDLSQVSPSEFATPKKPSGIGNTRSINILWRSDDGRVYGNITLTLYENNIVTAEYDKYDFGMHYPFFSNAKRNLATIAGQVVNFGEGDTFRILLHGEGVIGGGE